MEKWLISGRRSHHQPAWFQFNDQSVTALQIRPKNDKTDRRVWHAKNALHG